MKLSDEDKDYKDVIRMLEPRHAPVTEMRFIAPAPQGKWRKVMVRVARLAAILIVGIGIGVFLVNPDPSTAASKIIQLGMEKIRNSRECRIELMMRMKPSTPSEPIDLSPQGILTPVTFVYTLREGKSELNIDWTDSHDHHKLLLKQDALPRFDGKVINNETVPAEAFDAFSEVLYSGADGLRNILKSKKVSMKIKDGKITLEHYEKNGTAKMVAVFSDATGHLLSFKAYDTSTSSSLIMIETNSVSYH